MLLTALIFVLVLGVLVLIHELGHFTAAKLMGIKVEEFGFGLPPKLFGKKYGETEYTLNALPIGGFVRLYGEDEDHPEKVKKEKSRAFFARSPLQRSIVLCAGVIMNFVLGWAVISFLFTQGVMVQTDRVHVEEVSPGSPAGAAGIQKGDVIEQIRFLEFTKKSDNGTTVSSKEFPIKTSKDLIDVTKLRLGQEVTVAVDRGGKKVEFVLIPRENAPENEGAMGVTISSYEKKMYSWSEAPKMGLVRSFETMQTLVVGIGTTIWKAVTLQGVSKDVAGPIGIAKLTGEAVKFGSSAVLELLAMLSINLAVINILPIPALDGGRLLFVLIEGVTGKRLGSQWEKQIHQVGMILLLILILLITVNDIVRLVTG